MKMYPEKTCSIDRLLTQPKLIEAAKAGVKTQQRRDGVYGWPGETFQLDDQEFVITGLVRQRLGDLTDADAQAEGFPDLETYKSLIMRMHPGMEWNAEVLVWVHTFAVLVDA